MRPPPAPPRARRTDTAPDRTTPTGALINTYLTTTAATPLSGPAIHLLFAANRWEAAPALEALLRAGTTLVLDRYIYSGIAFGLARGLDYAWCKAPDVGLPAPDAVVFLDIDPAVAAARGGFGEERYERAELQAQVRRNFEEVGRREGQAVGWKVVDAGREVEAVADEVWSVVEQVMADVGCKDVGRIA